MRDRDKVRGMCRQVLEREKMGESPLRACSTCLQHRRRSRGEDQSSSDRFQNVENLFL